MAAGTAFYGYKVEFEESKPVMWVGLIVYVLFSSLYILFLVSLSTYVEGARCLFLVACPKCAWAQYCIIAPQYDIHVLIMLFCSCRYMVLTTLQALYAYFIEGEIIFVGKRKTFDKRVRLMTSSSVPCTHHLTTSSLPSSLPDPHRTHNNILPHNPRILTITIAVSTSLPSFPLHLLFHKTRFNIIKIRSSTRPTKTDGHK